MENVFVRLKQFGGPEELEIAEGPVPEAGPGEVLVRVLAASLQYTDVVIRRHRYPWILKKPPFVLGYDVVGQIERLGPGVTGLAIGDRVADLTVLGSLARYRTLRADRVARVPADVEAAEAATLILSWTTAYQLLHRAARVESGQRALVQGAAGAVGQALLVLGKLAGLKMWGAARAQHVGLLRELDATFVDAQERPERVLPGGFDAVFDGIAADGYQSSWNAVGRGGVLCAYGYSAAVTPERQTRMLTIGRWVGRLYLWSWLPNGKRALFYSINLTRARHPTWFKADLEQLFAMLAAGTIHPRVAERISFDRVVDGYRRLESGHLEGKLVLCPA